MQSPSSHRSPLPPGKTPDPNPGFAVIGPHKNGSRWRLQINLNGAKFFPGFKTRKQAMTVSAELLGRSLVREITVEDLYPHGRRGFASMEREQHLRIASAGGKKAHANGTAHRFTPQEAMAAGKLGAAVVRERFGVGHYREIGSRGGLQRAARAAAARAEAAARAAAGKAAKPAPRSRA